MSDIIEQAVNGHYDTNIQNLTYTVDNLNIRLKSLMAMLRDKGINETEESVLVGLAGQCATELHSYNIMLNMEIVRYEKIKKERAEAKEIESEKDTYIDPTSD